MFFYPYDYYYLILVVPALFISLWAQLKVKSTFNRYEQVYARQGITAAQAARRILDQNGLYGVRIEMTGGKLTDHYDPRTNVIRLSQSVYNSPSVAALGVAAHEAGHAVHIKHLIQPHLQCYPHLDRQSLQRRFGVGTDHPVQCQQPLQNAVKKGRRKGPVPAGKPALGK